MAGVANLFDGHIINQQREHVNLNDQQFQGKIIGLYFSAHWYLFDQIEFLYNRN